MAVGGGIQAKTSARELRSRLLLIIALVVLAFGLLVARLYYVQILRGEEFFSRGRSNFIHRIRTPHDRGIVYDRRGSILIDNRPSVDVEVTPYFLGENSEEVRATLHDLFEILQLEGEEREQLAEKVGGQRGLNRFRPMVIEQDISHESLAAILDRRGIFALDGVEIVPGRRRKYVEGTLAAHLLGYVNEIDRRRLDRELRDGNPHNYKGGDLLGRAGIEFQYEKQLRGDDGFEKIVVDAKGRSQSQSYVAELIQEQPRQPPRPGNNLYLTIDRELQAAAEEAFDGRAGSVVALDPHTGAIRALVSKPGFDLNLIGGVMAPAVKKEMDENILKPWINRSIRGQYAPGSTFKVVTALAALSGGLISPVEKINCPGSYRLGRHTWRCHKDSGHGMVNLKEALKYSCDTYFYSLSARMGIEPIAEAGRFFGVGERTGIALRGEKPGNMPDKAFHNRVERRSGGYQRGMALNTSIGQGAVLMTPLQVAVMYAALVNGGRVLEPQLVERVETPDFRIRRRALVTGQGETGEQIQEEMVGTPPRVIAKLKPVESGRLPYKEEQVAAIRAGLVAVAQEPGGTGYLRRSSVVSMAGKTGTAQVVRLGSVREKSADMKYFSRDHAWFASYAPVEAPEIVVVV
ncbi:MAG: penicillin-binding protein 2, partial [Myxococcota bacterium]|nr:penicillin-binding protein 2 [Myxococcota bacterium]